MNNRIARAALLLLGSLLLLPFVLGTSPTIRIFYHSYSISGVIHRSDGAFAKSFKLILLGKQAGDTTHRVVGQSLHFSGSDTATAFTDSTGWFNLLGNVQQPLDSVAVGVIAHDRPFVHSPFRSVRGVQEIPLYEEREIEATGCSCSAGPETVRDSVGRRYLVPGFEFTLPY